MTAKISSLTDSEKAIVDTITMNLHIRQSLQYLANAGFKMSERSYYRYKKRVQELKWERLTYVANTFTEQHLQRLDKLQLIEKLMWSHHESEKSPVNKVKILESIVKMQPFLSAYMDVTRNVMEGRLLTQDTLKVSEPEPVRKTLELEEFTEEEKRDVKNSLYRFHRLS